MKNALLYWNVCSPRIPIASPSTSTGDTNASQNHSPLGGEWDFTGKEKGAKALVFSKRRRISYAGLYAGGRKKKKGGPVLFDYERREQNSRTKLTVDWGVVVIVALLCVIVLCCTGHDGVAAEIAKRLPLR